MRIGTWNLEGRWDERHRVLIEGMDCDVLLLTEVSERVDIPGLALHLGSGVMAPRRRWAAIASRVGLVPLPDPHGASAMAEVAGLRMCASILPWRSCGSRDPWVGATTGERTEFAVSDVQAAGPEVWGGDWNHALSGREWSGSRHGRAVIEDAVDRLGLVVSTASAPHRLPGLLSIDHIAVPRVWSLGEVERYVAAEAGARISDHDAYVVQVERDGRAGC